jgi:LysM repeat protein
MFADLPVGMPEAQAAYFNGYNGGVDQYGRVVTAPFGIDLSFDVAEDIGLPSKKNDWIQVSYMWTEGWNSGGSSTGGGSSPPAATQEQVQPVDVSTPQADGKVVHVVQSGQTLWEIAVKYQVTLQEIYQLNGFTEDYVIRPGEELLIKTVQIDAATEQTTPTEVDKKKKTPAPSETQSSKATQTKTTQPKPSTAQALIGSATAPSPTDEQAVSQTGAVSPSIQMDQLYILIGFVVVAGLALMLVGTWMNRKY